MNADAPSLLSLSQLSVRFGGIQALKDISFAVKENSITAIIGPNGAGKTTVFNCLTGFYKPTTGDIRFNDSGNNHSIPKLLGQPYNGKDFLNPRLFGEKLFYRVFGGSHKVAAMGIARTFQNIRLFKDMTVLENLIVAQHRQLNKNLISGLLNLPAYKKSELHAARKAYRWLKFVELENEGNRLAGELPYGHQRRLEIARAMCTDAKLICLDEPAAGLNHKETEKLSELIVKLRAENTTVLVIEHDMSLIMQISDHIVVLDHGEVICEGAPETVRNDPKVISAYLGEED